MRMNIRVVWILPHYSLCVWIRRVCVFGSDGLYARTLRCVRMDITISRAMRMDITVFSYGYCGLFVWIFVRKDSMYRGLDSFLIFVPTSRATWWGYGRMQKCGKNPRLENNVFSPMLSRERERERERENAAPALSYCPHFLRAHATRVGDSRDLLEVCLSFGRGVSTSCSLLARFTNRLGGRVIRIIAPPLSPVGQLENKLCTDQIRPAA